MPVAVTAQFRHHFAQGDVLRHQHATAPGLSGGIRRLDFAQGIRAESGLLPRLQDGTLTPKVVGFHRALVHRQESLLAIETHGKARAQCPQAPLGRIHIK